MFCKQCGKEVADGTAFCPGCGASLDGASAPAPAPAAAPAKAKGKLNPLSLSALICQTVGALFMAIFCMVLMSDFSEMSSLPDIGFLGVIGVLLCLCAMVAVIFVPVCLWVVFGGTVSGNSKLTAQGNKVLSISVLVQLIVESVCFGALLIMMLFLQTNSDLKYLLRVLGLNGSMVAITLGLIVIAGACIFLHVMALRTTKGAAPNVATAVACFVAGGVHILTLLIFLSMVKRFDMDIFLLLGGFAAADIIYGIVTLKAKK